MNLSFQKMFFAIATIFALFAILVVAKTILIPLGLALLLSFILFPLVKKFESWGMNEILSSFLSLLTLILLIGGLIFFFSTQIMDLSKDFSAFKEKLMGLFTDVIFYINHNVSFVSDLDRSDVLEQLQKRLKNSAGSLAQNTFAGTSTVLAQLVATIVYTFLILLYRKRMTMAIVQFAAEENRARVRNMLKNVQQVGQKYLSGMMILIVILGVGNGVGLWIIGLESPFLFGFLAGVLSIIPYVGTTIGATIPVLYAFMTHDSLWIPFYVVILFWSVQLIEGNFLSPKIVGSSVKVNALAAILSLIIGASVWGIAGMVLFLPFTAMLKVVCEEFEQLKPIAILIGNAEGKTKDDDQNRIGKWFDKIKAWLKDLFNSNSK